MEDPNRELCGDSVPGGEQGTIIRRRARGFLLFCKERGDDLPVIGCLDWRI
jgi:hypothetical protein